MERQRTYIAIDLKSFYASVECVERGLDPLRTNLVVADESRTEKTICLAVSPSLKRYGIPGRARLFEVVQKVREINAERLRRAPGNVFRGSSYFENELDADPSLELAYIAAPPRMGHYMRTSTEIFSIYTKYISADDIHVYSIDEVFIDVTDYLSLYGLSARDLAMKLVTEVLNKTGITATAGIGTNMYLAKIAMDIRAKHMPPDENGVRMAELDEMSYRRELWDHRPISDFWRIGRGYAKKLAENGMYTMGDVARCSVGKPSDFHNEDLLYKLFGINAELLIDHAWGWEPCTIQDIKNYRPSSNSLSSGQVLQQPYEFDKARLVVREMADLLSLDLVDKKVVTDQLVLTVGYDIENLADPERRSRYRGEVKTDFYGRPVPKHANGSINLGRFTSSSRIIAEAAVELFDRIVSPGLLVRRMYVVANHVNGEGDAGPKPGDNIQTDLFTDYEALERQKEAEDAELSREHDAQEAILAIKRKFGKNAIVRGMNLEEGATAIARNGQIGGHKA